MDLAFPEIDEGAGLPAAVTSDESVVTLARPAPTLKEIALLGFADTERQIAESEKTLKGVVHDLSTATKLDSAISLRNRLVKKPLAAMRAKSKDIKSALDQCGKDVTAREAELVADFERVEAHITPQIEARQKQIAEEEQREAERKARHTAGISRIAGYVAQAAESTAAALEAGIPRVEAIDVTGFEEFTKEAQETKDRTLASLRALLEKALAREAAAKLLAAQTLALEIGQRVTDLIGQPADAIRNALNLLELTSYPEGIDLSVLRAHGAALVQLRAMLAAAEKAAADAAELAKLRAAEAPAPVPPAPASEPAPMPAQHKQEAAPALNLQPTEPTLDAAAPQATHIELRPGVMVRVPDPDSRPPLTTGAVSDRLGFIVAAGFIERLGITPAPRPEGAKSGTFWRAADFARICDELMAHIDSVRGAA